MKEWKKLKGVLDSFVEEGWLTGCGMQVYKDNQLIYNNCVGSATLDHSVPLTAETRLRLYSLSKTFTCTALHGSAGCLRAGEHCR